MEKWRSRGRSYLKPDVDYPKNHNKFEWPTPPEKKKTKRWKFGNFLRRKSKEPPVPIVTTATQTTPTIEIAESPTREDPPEPQVCTKMPVSSMDSVTSPEVRPEDTSRNGRRNRLKARMQAKRERYGNSSSDEEDTSNSLLRIHSEDSIQGSPKCDYNNKRSRGARTERYMKRLYTNGDRLPSPIRSKYPSDTLPPVGSPGELRWQTHRKYHSYSNYPFGSDCSIPNCWPKIADSCANLQSSQTNWSAVRATERIQPPDPPPRAFKLHLPARYSLPSDVDNDPEAFRYNRTDVNCNSLDRMCNPRRSSGRSVRQEAAIPANATDERRRHSKNLEEALEELETIYNSLRLSDEDLLDRAEQRSMEEYRDKLATTAVDGSIKSTSDTSSNEMTRELAWRDVDRENDSRLKDDMAYRRMHHVDRPSSVDNYGSMARVSYLTTSPCSWREPDCADRPKSRRATPDLTRDDVVFRSISHANNTLKIVDPQPPFGIPLGPVSGAAESDYLHVEPHRDTNRSLYIPKTEPDVVADDLAFRSLRKDTSRDRSLSPGNMSFLPKTLFVPEVKKKRAVRSLSADLYGIINKDRQSSWYREYVKLNRPLRVSGIVEAVDRDDLDINGNKPKTSCKGKVQVCIPRESSGERTSVEVEIADKCGKISPSILDDTRFSDKAIPSFTDHELSEYRELCRELESLIRKTSERVKIVDKVDSVDSEFVEWETILGKNHPLGDGIKVAALGKTAVTDDEVADEFLPGERGKIVDSVNHKSVGNQMNLSVEQVCNVDQLDDSIAEMRKDGSSDGDTTNDTFETDSNDKSDDIFSDKLNDHNSVATDKGESTGHCNVKLCRHLVKSIMNVRFVTNCLTAYSVALWSLCLTLLIAIIVAL